MNQHWIDFKTLREQLDFLQVLKDYGIELKPRANNQFYGFCPLPGHNGKKKSPSFSVNLAGKMWKCFGCTRGGNILDLVIYLEGKDPDNRQHVREVAVMLAERYGVGGASPPEKPDDPKPRPGNPPRRQVSSPKTEAQPAQKKPSEVDTRPVNVNAPLDFELKGLDPDHPYLKERGFTRDTILHFGLGFCNRGLMAGRVVIPLHNPEGKLIGYAGRFTRDDQISEKNPKYLFPSNRERDGKILEFRKSHFLYNGHRIREQVRDLYVVEGFASVWWLTQAGFEDVVALMGNSCSQEQVVLIRSMVSPSGRVWIFPDAGDGGTRCAQSLLMQLSPHRFCHWVKLGEGQPTDLSPDDLVKLLEWKVVP